MYIQQSLLCILAPKLGKVPVKPYHRVTVVEIPAAWAVVSKVMQSAQKTPEL